MAHHADALKAKGNDLFKLGDFAGAEEQYTQAIQRYSKNPLIFTNRAFARIKLQRWDGVVDDCMHSIELTGSEQNFKAYFYLAQAQLALNRPNEALSSSLSAYDQAMYPKLNHPSPPAASMSAIVALVIRCRKSKFESRQREISSQRGELLGELEAVLDATARDEVSRIGSSLSTGEIGPVAAEEARTDALNLAASKMERLRNVFAIADPELHARRDVPDWAIDTISFELMHDPVVTKDGHSYERMTIVEHLKRSPTDPLTREPLTVEDLRPNIALRKALDEFWEGAEKWAIDW